MGSVWPVWPVRPPTERAGTGERTADRGAAGSDPRRTGDVRPSVPTVEEHMSTPDTDAAGDVVAGGPGRLPMTRRELVVRTGAVLALVAVLAGGWWWTHPQVFTDDFVTAGQAPRPLADATSYQGLPGLQSGQRDETITITGYEVHYARNGADATARLLVCVPRASYGDAAFGFGGDSDEVKRACQTLRPVEDGTRFEVRQGWPPPQYLVLEVEPTKPGQVTVDEIEISYRRSGEHLFQQGTQHIENVFRLSAT